MSSAQFEYNNNLYSPGTFGERMSDTWLGTSFVDNKNNNALLNYQMKFNEYMQDKANLFNEKMSSTAYQRAVKDMQSAGINPMVAMSGGAKAASSPISAMTSSPSANAPSYDKSGGIIGRATAKMVNNFVDNLTGKSLRDNAAKIIGAVF